MRERLQGMTHIFQQQIAALQKQANQQQNQDERKRMALQVDEIKSKQDEILAVMKSKEDENLPS